MSEFCSSARTAFCACRILRNIGQHA